MEIGNDDLEFYDEMEDSTQPNDELNLGNSNDTIEPNEYLMLDNNYEDNNQDEFIDSLLKSRGINDRLKIKFEDEEGSVVEYNWDNLNTLEKLNILNSSLKDPEVDLDDAETLLINIIRSSGLTPEEYLEYIQNLSIDNYIKNTLNQEYHYQIDLYSDDELFIFDLISRMGDITEEEALEALERAKSNESLFSKQVKAIRNEYKTIEEENIKQAQLEQEEYAKEQYNHYANQIADQINDFNEFSGYDLNLTDEDKDDLYEFITGLDKAGNNYFAKALSDPKILVLTAWFALNGKLMIDDITSYFLNEIKLVRKESYLNGLEDAHKIKSGTNVAFVDKKLGSTNNIYDDLDNF